MIQLLKRCLSLSAPTLLIASQLPGISLAATPTHPSASSRFDSIGTERRDGRRYVLHRVDQGQTLFAVARRYHVSVDAIRTANPDLGEGGARYDQLLRIPTGASAAVQKETPVAEKATPAPTRSSEKTTAPKATQTTGNGTHVVATGQTLYSLAARYGVSMAQLREWNHLGADGIRVGQTLIVSEQAAASRTTPPTKPAPTQAPPRQSDSPEASRNAATPSTEASSSRASSEVDRLETKPLVTPAPPLRPGSKPKSKTEATDNHTETRTEAPRTQPAETPPPTRPAESVADVRPTTERTPAPKATPPTSDNEPVAATTKAKGSPVKVQSEIGFADVIEGDNQSSKYLALHRSAPVGTLVQVRNDISNQSLYVKVVGKLPDTGLNDQVLIRLSNRAFEKLSPNGQRFRAEVSYAK